MLRLGNRTADEMLVMAIVNRTPDSFYDRGATFALENALHRVDQVVSEGADIVDVGGVKAAPGAAVDVAEEIDRTASFVALVRERYPDLIISVDTWRHEVAREACRAGADLVNDAWGGVDPKLAEVAAEYGAGLVCTHAGGLPPRTRPHRIEYDDVVGDVISTTTALAARAVAAGVDPARVLIDPGHDFGKNTWHSLEVTRRIDELVATGWPVLVSLSNKDFVGESLGGLPVAERMFGTLAVSAICAWQGAQVFRAHNVAPTRQVVDMVAVTRGNRPPALTIRGLA
jgi:dihydropteroate synthase